MDMQHRANGDIVDHRNFISTVDKEMSITRPSEIPNEHYQDRTVGCRRREKFMPRRLGQQTHRSTE